MKTILLIPIVVLFNLQQINAQKLKEKDSEVIAHYSGESVSLNLPDNEDDGTNSKHVKISDFEFGVEEVAFSEVEAYPNPTNNGMFTIDLGKKYKNLKVKIINMLGKEVSSTIYDDTDQIELVILGKNGTYLVELITEKNQTTILQVIK